MMVTDENIHEESYQKTDIRQKKNKQGEHDSKRQMDINLNLNWMIF